MNVKVTYRGPSAAATAVRDLPVIVGSGPSADLVLDDPAASACHCMIDRVDGVLVVYDLVSQGGTLLNGRRVEESPLKPGDELTVGTTCLVVQGIAQDRSAIMMEAATHVERP